MIKKLINPMKKKSLMISGKSLMNLAFNGPETSPACAKIGKMLSKNEKGLSVDELLKQYKKSESEVVFSLNRLANNIGVLEYSLDLKNLEDTDKGKKLPVKYRFKKSYIKPAKAFFK